MAIFGEAFGVVGDDSVEDGWSSNAVWNDANEAAVSGVAAQGSGAFDFTSDMTDAELTFTSGRSSSLKGFFTSRATLITTSNSMASSRFGSRYR